MFFYEGADNVVAHNAVIMADGDSMFVKAGVVVGSNTDWDGVEGSANGSFQVLGTIMSVGGTGLHAAGDSNFFQVGVGGAIVGSTHFGSALAVEGNSTRVFNDGTISGSVGVNLTGGSALELVNNGFIHGIDSVAVHLGNSAGTLTNTGVISSSDDYAIRIDTLNSGFLTLRNSGTIAGGDLFSGAIYMADGTGPALFTNTGEIDGNVKLGPDDDTFDGSLGRMNGILYGYYGDDVLITGAGRDDLEGGPGADTLDGGAGRDFLDGDLGSDTLDGGEGRDRFFYAGVSDSGGANHDTLLNFDFREDFLDLSVDVTGIDATVHGGTLRTTHFADDLHAAVNGAALAVQHAVLFMPKTGNLAGHTFLVVDANGHAGYQANADYVFDLTDAANLASLNVRDFI